jgi:hypothetical protein
MKPHLQALTLIRPWSALIIGAPGVPRKDIENRTWHPEPLIQPGEWLAIHSGRKYDEAASAFAYRIGVPMTFYTREHLVDAAIIGVARYDGYVRASASPWFVGPLGWLLGGVVALPDPIPCRGGQGLWRVPADVAERVRTGYRISAALLQR